MKRSDPYSAAGSTELQKSRPTGTLGIPGIPRDDRKPETVKKKVSVAWIVRDAAEKYVADQWPLFAKSQL